MATDNEHGLLGVADSDYEELPLSDGMSWLRHRIEKFVLGGIYLIAGQPGIGKSTLGVQMGLDLGRRGERTLYILTEQSKEDLARRARRMSGEWDSTDRDRALKHILPEDTIYDIETLPQFLAQQVLSKSGKYHGVRFIILDSVQGHGLSAAATRKYKQVYEFCRHCKGNGITVLLVAHVTKKGDVAGPKDLEHNVDCVLVMRKAMIYRPMFVPKNRFGPALLKPVPLEMDRQSTALKLSRHSDSVSSVARAYLGHVSGIVEAQAAVSLPAYGTRGKITAPGLPKKEIEQLTTCISQIPDMEIEDLDYAIQCRIPGDRRYRGAMGLPLCMALIASYVQKDIPAYHIYLGEIDLLRKVRDVPDELLTDLCDQLQKGELPKPLKIFCSRASAEIIADLVQSNVTAVACDKLEDAVFRTWPEVQPISNGASA